MSLTVPSSRLDPQAACAPSPSPSPPASTLSSYAQSPGRFRPVFVPHSSSFARQRTRCSSRLDPQAACAPSPSPPASTLSSYAQSPGRFRLVFVPRSSSFARQRTRTSEPCHVGGGGPRSTQALLMAAWNTIRACLSVSVQANYRSHWSTRLPVSRHLQWTRAQARKARSVRSRTARN